MAKPNTHKLGERGQAVNIIQTPVRRQAGVAGEAVQGKVVPPQGGTGAITPVYNAPPPPAKPK